MFGLVALFFARRYPDAEIVSIEPDPENYRLLVANTAHLKNVTTIKGALWHQNENLEFVNELDEKYALAVVASDLGSISGVTVDAVLERQGWEFADLLKMDIEGGESEVLSNGNEWVDRVGSLIVELHQDVAPDAANKLFSCYQDCDIWLGWRGENLVIRNRTVSANQRDEHRASR